MKSLEKEQKQLEKERKSLEKQINKAYRKAEKMEKSAQMKFKFKNLIAFTLSEMMIVLLIVSVISAATIPTITQQKQKPYNVTENNSTSTNHICKYYNF